MGQAAEIADHHAKAVVERHRNAYPVVLGEVYRPGDEKSVVQNIVVAERGALWEAGRAAGELDVYRVVELQLLGERRKAVPLGIAGDTGDIVKPHHAADVVGADRDHQPQFRQPQCVQITRRCSPEFRGQFAQHRVVIAGLELRGGHKGDAARLVERVFELRQPIGGVDVDENEPGFCSRELGDHPFGVVRRPDADTIAPPEPQREQPCSKGVDPFFQLAVCPADPLMADDQCIALAKAFGDPIEMHADRVPDKGRAAGAMDVTQLRHLRGPYDAGCGRSAG